MSRKAVHAVLRAADRYGLTLAHEDLDIICGMIQENQGEFIRIDSDKKTHWWVTYKNTRARVLISPDFYTVVTFLPPFEKNFKAVQRLKKRHIKKQHRRVAVYKSGELSYRVSS